MSRVVVPVELLTASSVAWCTAWFHQEPSQAGEATREPPRGPDVAAPAVQAAPAAPGIGTAVGEWVAWMTLRELSDAHLGLSQRSVILAAASMGWQTLDDLANRDAVERWLEELRRRGRSPKTRNEHRNALSRFCAFCESRGWISSNPVPATPRARQLKRRARITPSVEDVVALIDYARQDWRKRDRWLTYLAAATTGLRWGQLKGLEWEHVRLEADPPYLDLPARLCKNGEASIVWLTAELAEALREAKGRDYVFTPNAGDAPEARVFRSVPKPTSFDRDLAGAGLHKGGGDRGTLSFHSLRHFASNRMAWSGGFTTAERQQQNQHRTEAMTTQTYTDPGAVDLGRRVHAMAPLLEGVAS